MKFYNEFENDVHVPKKYIRIKDTFEKYNENQFFKRYRFSKIIILNQILILLGIEHANNHEIPIWQHRQFYNYLLYTLPFYAALKSKSVSFFIFSCMFFAFSLVKQRR